MNFSQLYDTNATISHQASINVREALTGFCAQIDDKVVLGLFFIFTFYVMGKLILPYSREYFNTTIFKDTMNMIFDRFESMSETFALMSIAIIVIFRWIQGISALYKLWAYVLIGLAVLVKILEFQDYRRRKKDGDIRD